MTGRIVARLCRRCREIVENERTKARIAADLPKDAVADAAQEEADDAIKPTVHAQLYCVPEPRAGSAWITFRETVPLPKSTSISARNSIARVQKYLKT